jgi:hypothetical protein
MRHLLGQETSSRTRYLLGSGDLLRNWLVMAQSGWGKSLLLYGCLAALMHGEPTVPILLLDGAGTLARNLFVHWFGYLQRTFERLRAAGDPNMDATMAALWSRVVYMKVEDENQSGVAIDLAKRQWTVDSSGTLRLETAKERVASIMGSLAFTTVDAETFRLVHKYGRAGFGLLVAAGRTLDELPQLFRIESQSFRERLRTDIERHIPTLDLASPEPPLHGEPGRFEWKQWRVIEDLFASVGRNGIALDKETGSTIRNFDWLLEHFDAYFCEDTLDLSTFTQRGGVLLVETCSRNQHANANARAAIYSLYQSARAAHRTPSLTVIDEQHNLNVDLYADYVAANARNASAYHWFSLHSTTQLRTQLPTIWQACQRKIIGSIGEEDLARLVLLHSSAFRADGMYLSTLSSSTGWSADQSDAESLSSSTGHTEDEGGIEETTEARLEIGSNQKNPYKYREYIDPITSFDAVPLHLQADPQQPNFDYHDDTLTRLIRSRPSRSTQTRGEQEGQTHTRRKGTSGSQTRGRERISVDEQMRLLIPAVLNQPQGCGIHLVQGFEPFRIAHHAYSEPLTWRGAARCLPAALNCQRYRCTNQRMARIRARAEEQRLLAAVPHVLERSPDADTASPAPVAVADQARVPAASPTRRRAPGPRPRWAKKGGRR